MTCVMCKMRVVDEMWDNGKQKHSSSSFVVCSDCRRDHYPEHLKDIQYQRYWLAFAKKWRKENEMRNL